MYYIESQKTAFSKQKTETSSTLPRARYFAKMLSLLDGDAYIYKDKSSQAIEKWTFGKKEY
jgi:predicted negative regulator of RcsB-dependent stress response